MGDMSGEKSISFSGAFKTQNSTLTMVIVTLACASG
jgi:hypothetical protein